MAHGVLLSSGGSQESLGLHAPKSPTHVGSPLPHASDAHGPAGFEEPVQDAELVDALPPPLGSRAQTRTQSLGRKQE